MKMLKKTSSSRTLASLCIVFILAGCNGPSDQNRIVNKAVADSINREISLSPESQILLNNFPTPFEVTALLIKAKAGYSFDIANTPDWVDNYNTEMSKALNLGVYSADLCYSVTYKRIDETNKFLACTNKLADELGIAGIYDKTLMDKFKKNDNNNEEMIALVKNLFRNSNDFLSKNNRTQVAVMVVSGAFTEGIYLAASAAVTSVFDNSQILAVIAAQKENYEKLTAILSAYNSDPKMKSLADDMATLKPIWIPVAVTPGKKVSREQAEKIFDLAGSVRDKMVK